MCGRVWEYVCAPVNRSWRWRLRRRGLLVPGLQLGCGCANLPVFAAGSKCAVLCSSVGSQGGSLVDSCGGEDGG